MSWLKGHCFVVWLKEATHGESQQLMGLAMHNTWSDLNKILHHCFCLRHQKMLNPPGKYHPFAPMPQADSTDHFFMNHLRLLVWCWLLRLTCTCFSWTLAALINTNCKACNQLIPICWQAHVSTQSAAIRDWFWIEISFGYGQSSKQQCPSSARWK